MLPLDWVERPRPRRFGKVFREDVIACQQVNGKSDPSRHGGTAPMADRLVHHTVLPGASTHDTAQCYSVQIIKPLWPKSGLFLSLVCNNCSCQYMQAPASADMMKV